MCVCAFNFRFVSARLDVGFRLTRFEQRTAQVLRQSGNKIGNTIRRVCVRLHVCKCLSMFARGIRSECFMVVCYGNSIQKNRGRTREISGRLFQP